MKEWYEFAGQKARVCCKDGEVYEGYIEDVLGPPDYEPEEESIMIKPFGGKYGIEIMRAEIEKIEDLN